MNRALQSAFAERGVVVAGREPALRHALRRAHAAGEVRPVLRGVWAPAAVAGAWRTRVAALTALDPDAVIAQEAARVLDGQPPREFGPVVAHRRGGHRPHPGFRWCTGDVPPELVTRQGGVSRTAPALTALDLVPSRGGDAIDEALRSGVRLAQLWEALALTPDRPGNAERRLLLHDSRDEPWSEAERLGHRLFRTAGLVGWRTNVPIRLPTGTFVVDALFEAERVIVEFDGYAYHRHREMFESDRHRDFLLHAARWTVVRITWRMLTEDPAEVITVLRLLLSGEQLQGVVVLRP